MDNLNKYSLEWKNLNEDGYSLRKIAELYNVSHNSVSRILRKHQIPIKEWHSSKFKDITNHKFGLITALEPINSKMNSKGAIYWRCICSCDPTKSLEILGTDLRRNRKTHCGCNFPRKFDISEQTFGLLTALRDSRIRKSGHVLWECICECSTLTFVTYGDLVNGHTKSCGCQRPRGEKHYKWNGGSEVKLFLRGHLKAWKKASLFHCNFKCVISNEKKHLEIHHLVKSFIVIFHEALKICNLKQHSYIGTYSEDELTDLIKKIITLHYHYGLGVAITRDLHNEFHSLYGYNNCIGDFEEFIMIKKTENIKKLDK